MGEADYLQLVHIWKTPGFVSTTGVDGGGAFGNADSRPQRYPHRKVSPGQLLPAAPGAGAGWASRGGGRAHLHDERTVLGTGLVVEVLAAVVGVPEEDLGVQHRCVAELGAVAAAQQPPGQLALVHHGRHHVVGTPQRLPPEGFPAQFRHLPPARPCSVAAAAAPRCRPGGSRPEARRPPPPLRPGRAPPQPDGATAISLRLAQRCSRAPSPPETEALPARAARGRRSGPALPGKPLRGG